jgi:nucleotide-binding universal stress UspA family protein
MLGINKILFPCDLTGQSSKIITYALSISEKFNSRICLLHVVQDLHELGELYMPRVSFEWDQKKALECAETAMESLCEEKLQGCFGVEKWVATGDPATEILKAIESGGIDLVIMGTHGRKGLQETVFGSVAEIVVKNSPVPVLVINPYKLEKVHPNAA